jgi:hypothetical protein
MLHSVGVKELIAKGAGGKKENTWRSRGNEREAQKRWVLSVAIGQM